MALLRQIYGAQTDKLKVEQRSFQVPSKSTAIDLTVVYSAHHLEINASDSGHNDRFVVQEVIKDIAQNQPLIDVARDQKRFKVVVLNEVDKLTKEAQHALRRTMEKYTPMCRLILVCNNSSKVIEAVRSRCLCIRIAAPSIEEICRILSNIAKKEGLTLPDPLAQTIAKQSERNLRLAILMLEATKIKQYPFKPNQEPEKADWEIFVDHIAKEILDEQSPARLLAVRTKLHELLIHCIPPSLIIKQLTEALIPKLDTALKHHIIKWAAFYEHRLQCGSKPIFHLEAFVAKFMSIYRSFLIHNFGE